MMMADLDRWLAQIMERLEGVASNVEIAALGRLIEQQRDDIAGLKDDVVVLTAIVQRLDNSHTLLLTEIRATHGQISRLSERIRRSEEDTR